MLLTLIRSTQVTVVHEGAIVDVLMQYKETPRLGKLSTVHIRTTAIQFI